MNSIKNEELLILAGGFGTRISSISNNLPKIMMPIGDRPFLDYQMEQWIGWGFSNFRFLLHYKAEEIISHFGTSDFVKSKNLNISFEVEREPLGTGGAVMRAINEKSMGYEWVTVVNGDTFIDADVRGLHKAPHTTLLLLENQPMQSRFGGVTLGIDDRIVSFDSVPSSSKNSFANSGMIRLEVSKFSENLKAPFSFEKLLVKKLNNDEAFFGLVVDGLFTDIGIPNDYFDFCKISN